MSAPSGDWIVTDAQFVKDRTIVLRGNLIVEAGGNLTLRNVRLVIDCSFVGQYGIEVKSRGAPCTSIIAT